VSEFRTHFMELMTDPAHLAFEVATTIIFALLAQLVTWPVVARRIRREHTKIDAEHGIVDHNEPEVEEVAPPSWVNS
jgi:NhaP-type Na+/H+ or K+/H+ antiporter